MTTEDYLVFMVKISLQAKSFLYFHYFLSQYPYCPICKIKIAMHVLVQVYIEKYFLVGREVST